MAEFNKGYYRRQGKAIGKYEERERIIKLLENRMILAQQQSEIAPDTYQGQHEKESAYIEISNARWAIATIKGENKCQ